MAQHSVSSYQRVCRHLIWRTGKAVALALSVISSYNRVRRHLIWRTGKDLVLALSVIISEDMQTLNIAYR